MQDEGKFTPDPEFQFVPIPKTNPALVGHRFKEYYAALGPTLKNRYKFTIFLILSATQT